MRREVKQALRSAKVRINELAALVVELHEENARLLKALRADAASAPDARAEALRFDVAALAEAMAADGESYAAECIETVLAKHFGDADTKPARASTDAPPPDLEEGGARAPRGDVSPDESEVAEVAQLRRADS